MVNSTRSSHQRPRQGSQTPTREAFPSFATTELDQCLAVCKAGDLEPFDWQVRVLMPWLAVDANGKWLVRTCGLSVPRQNGKTLGTVAARAVYGMLARNEQIVYTSHAQTTSTETFEGIRDIFESKRLKSYVSKIQGALGREAIYLKSGARIKFYARTRNGGRGKHGDLMIFDEAQELTDSQQASFKSVISASTNPQTIYLGTPPDEKAPGVVFRRIRERALAGDNTRSWAEWSVDEIGDVTDRKRWYKTNPSLGLLIEESTVESECGDYAADKFAIERLGWWSDIGIAHDCPINAEAWKKCETNKPPKDGVMAIGVKFSPDGSRVALAVCLKPEDGLPYVEVVQALSTSRGTQWVASWLLERKAKIASVCIDGRRGEATIQRLIDEHWPKAGLRVPGSADVAKACAMFVDAIDAQSIEHFGQPDLDTAATCPRRRIGTDGFGFESTDTADATLIEACALAYREAMTTKRKTGRKLRVSY